MPRQTPLSRVRCTPNKTFTRQEEPSQKILLQLGVLRLGFLQDGDVGVGVFPEGEEVLVGGAGLGGVAAPQFPPMAAEQNWGEA